MSRSRDVEAIEKASEIIETVAVDPALKPAGIIVGARAYRKGVEEGALRSHNMVASLEAETRELRAKLLKIEGQSVFSFAEIQHVVTLREHGMTVGEVARVMGVRAIDVRNAMREAKSKAIRYASDRKS